MRSIKYLSNMGAVLALMFLIASCSTIKNMRKERDKTKEQTESKVEETSKSKTVEDLKAKSLTTIEADTTATIKGKSESGSTPFASDGTVGITLDDGSILELREDKGRGIQWTFVRPDVAIPFKFKKTVYTEEDKKTTTTVKKDSSAKVDTAKETDRTLKTKEVKRNGLPWWIWLIIALVILGVIAWRYLKDSINDKIDGIL